MSVIEAFNNIKSKPFPKQEGIGGFSDLRDVAAIQVGTGDRAFKADQSGIWLGANKFADANFSIDMQGNLIASSAILTGSGYTKINIFKQDGIPTSIAIGDLWFDTNDSNKLYRAGSIGSDAITDGEWELVQDETIAIAQGTADGAVTDASDAQDTANSKIKVFAQNGIPTSVTIGDIWYDTDDKNKPYVAESVGADAITAGEWVLVDDARAADALLKAGTSQTLTGNFNLNDANILIDGANKRIVINDGTDDRILLGYQSGGF